MKTLIAVLLLTAATFAQTPDPGSFASVMKKPTVPCNTGQVLVQQADATWACGSPSAGSVAWTEVTGKPSTFAPSSHGNEAHSSAFATLANPDFTGTVTGISKGMVGLGSVDNTADASKSVASAATLTTPRTINGISFNGSANITVTADLSANPSPCPGGQYVNDISANGTLTCAQPAGGSDPWTVVKVTGSNFSTTSATAVDITGLAFTPAANTTYEFSGVLMIRTATTTVNPRVGLAWATGMTDGVASIDTAQTATTQLTTLGNIAAALLAAVGGIPNTTQSWPVNVGGMVVAGASPSGTIRVQLASETAGTAVTVIVGSFLRWRAL